MENNNTLKKLILKSLNFRLIFKKKFFFKVTSKYTEIQGKFGNVGLTIYVVGLC